MKADDTHGTGPECKSVDRQTDSYRNNTVVYDINNLGPKDLAQRVR